MQHPKGEELLATAERAAQAAAVELRTRFRVTLPIDLKSSPTDPVTEADRSAEDAITAVLRAERPDDGLVGEEGARRASSSGIDWVVDPLDGTANYLFGSTEWSVSIGARDQDGPLVGVVLEPMTGRCFTAIRGGGAFEDGEPLRCRSTDDLGGALVMMGLSYDAARRAEQLDEFGSMVHDVRDFRRHGSAALELCRVASGRADAYVESPIMSWDIEAGMLIAREAGADVLVDELPGHVRTVVAAVPGIRAELTDVLQRTRTGQGAFGYLRNEAVA